MMIAIKAHPGRYSLQDKRKSTRLYIFNVTPFMYKRGLPF